MPDALHRLGVVDIATICEGFAPLPLADECPGEAVDWSAERALHPWAFVDDEHWAWHVHAFLVHTPNGDVLVDTGVGEFGPWAPWAEEQRFEAWSAVDEHAVRHVVLTHLHADHAGGSVLADGAPRFPNARYHVHPEDWKHFESSPVHRPTDAARYDARTAMAELVTSGAVSLEPNDYDVTPGVRVIHTPGHTPGHRSVFVRDEGETLLLTGDLLHVPAQVTHPEWPSSHDEDAATGAASRVACLATARDRGWQLAVSHFAQPFGRVGDGHWSSARS